MLAYELYWLYCTLSVSTALAMTMRERFVMPPLEDLLTYLFEGKKSAFHVEFEDWLRTSRRFKEFAIAHRSKIHGKLRNVRDEGGLHDLRAELKTAFVLLGEERFNLEYEKYVALKKRGPDFTVTFKTHTPFNVEVRRLRSRDLEDDADAQAIKLMAVLCDKIGQMPPSIINVLWLIAEPNITEINLKQAIATLLQRAEQKDEAFFARRGFRNAAAFHKQYRHLSGIALSQVNGQVLWLNPVARHPMPPELMNALGRLPGL
jgi:hypothetical protein